MKVLSEADLFPHLLSALADCVWETELDAKGAWHSRFISPAIEELTGYPADWFHQDFRRWSSIVHPEDFVATQRASDEFLASDRQLLMQEYRIMHADGRERWLQVRSAAQRSESGRVKLLSAGIIEITNRKTSETRVRHNELLLTQVLETVADGILFIDPHRYVVFANPAAEKLFGVPRSELVGRSWSQRRWKTTLPDGRPVPPEQHGDKVVVERGQALYGLERLITRGDGTQVYVSCNVVPLRDGEGRIAGSVVTYTDISARVQAEKELRKREHHFRTLVERSSDAIALIDERGNIQYATASSEQVLGYPQDEFVGIDGFSLVHPDDLDWVGVEFKKVLDDPTLVTRHAVRVRAKDGRFRSIESTLSNHLTDPAVGALVVNFRDVTDREQAAAALRASEERFRDLFERNLAGVFRTRMDGTIVECNDACARIFGFESGADMIGRSSIEFYPLPEDRQRIATQVIKDGGLSSAEIQMRKRDRTPVWVLENVTLRQKGDEPPFFEGTLIDITDRKRAEEQLQQARKLEALGQLAGGVAHDFNNLLTVILGNLSLAHHAMPVDHPVHAFLLETEKAASRAADLTSQLLGFARRRAIFLEPMSFGRVIKEVVALLQRTIDPRIQLEVEIAQNLWPVQGDAGQLHSVLLNLCLNARDAMPEGGLLRIEAGNEFVEEFQAAQQSGARTGEFVCLRIEDTGCGMSPEVQRRIFEPFFTTKAPNKGTGLGLATTFGIVQQHQGWIECDTEPGHGTCFCVYIPRSTRAAESAHDTGAAPESGNETILLVDDEDMVRTVASAILKKYGYKVVEARDGVEAIEIYRALGSEIDLVILDMMMPRLSGRESFLQLQKLNPNIRVLMSSGYATETLSAEERSGMCGFVHKPYRAGDLAAAVRAAIDAPDAVGMHV